MINVRKCIELGDSLQDKLALGAFAMLAPSKRQRYMQLSKAMQSIYPTIIVRPKNLKGLGVLINSGDWSQTVIFEEIFIRNGYDLRKVCFEPDAIFDCGAHIGMFTILAKSTFPAAKITAFEPNPVNMKYIRSQIKINSLDIEVQEAAVSIENIKARFLWTNSHSGRIAKDHANNVGEVVDVIDFPALVKKQNLKSIVVKLDVEGEETRILPALMSVLPTVAAIFFEVHSGEKGWREIEGLLIANRFQVEKINSRGDFYDGFAIRIR